MPSPFSRLQMQLIKFLLGHPSIIPILKRMGSMGTGQHGQENAIVSSFTPGFPEASAWLLLKPVLDWSHMLRAWIYIAFFISFQESWELPPFGTWALLDIMWPSRNSWAIGSSLTAAFVTQGEQSCRQGKVSKFLWSITLHAVIFIAEILSQVTLSRLQTMTFGGLTMLK